MTLREKQSAFARCAAALIQQMERSGYEVTFGETYRPPETAALFAKQGKGSKNSLHIQRLAIDLNLFLNGKYLTATEDHRIFGEWWEAYGLKLGLPLYWGGRFVDKKGRPEPDGNHYSLSPDNGKTK